MRNNKTLPNAETKVDLRVIRQQTRLLKRYSELRLKAGEPRPSGYRALADEIGVNVRYVFEFVTKGLLPTNEDVREKLLEWRPGGPKEAQPMEGLMLKLYNLVRLHHIGKKSGIKKRDLLRELYSEAAARDESYNNPYDRALREMIKELNHDHGALICSTSKDGYFWASSLGEGLRTVERDEKRARTQLDNTSHLRRNLQQAFGGQLEMEM